MSCLKRLVWARLSQLCGMSRVLAYLPAWRGDETLYSWAAGFHVTAGNGSARATGATLFSSEHACRERDAPTNLHHFAAVTRETLGDVKSLLLTRSPVGLFVPFLSAPRRSALAIRLAYPDGPGWYTLFGMPATGLGNRTELRFCKACVTEDLATWGLPRWRLPHQLVGTWICRNHGMLLEPLDSKTSAWVLPQISPRKSNERVPSQSQYRGLLRLATLAHRLIGVETLDIESIRQAVLTGLRDQGVTGWGHPLDKTALGAWFGDSALAVWLRGSRAHGHSLASGNWIHDLLRNRRGDHPLKWMLLWCALHGNDEDEAWVNRFLDPVIAPRWDADGQGQIWGASGDAVPAHIHRIVADAPTLQKAATRLGLSVHSLGRRLTPFGSSPGPFRQEHTYDQRRSVAVDAVDSYILTHQECSRSDVHRACKAAVSWLRRHDPDTLLRLLGQVDHKRSRQLEIQM